MDFDYKTVVYVALASAAWAAIQKLPGAAWDALTRYLTREITVYETDPGFLTLCNWLDANIENPHSMRLTSGEEGASAGPGLGRHWFRYMGVWVIASRDKMENQLRPIESVRVKFLSRKVAPRQHLLEKLQRTEDFVVYVATGGWFRRLYKQPRPLNTVYSPWRDRLAKEIMTFFGAKSEYVDRGVPWRKAYLFHGPHRTGKTSLAHALASHSSKPVYYLNPASQTDSDFTSCMADVPMGSIVLLEDLGHPPDKEKPEDGVVTPSTLLNALDGLIAPVGTIIIGTTNHIESLPPALVERFEALRFDPIDMNQLTSEQRSAVCMGQNQHSEAA